MFLKTYGTVVQNWSAIYILNLRSLSFLVMFLLSSSGPGRRKWRIPQNSIKFEVSELPNRAFSLYFILHYNYRSILINTKALLLTFDGPPNIRHGFHLFPLLTKKMITRSRNLSIVIFSVLNFMSDKIDCFDSTNSQCIHQSC